MTRMPSLIGKAAPQPAQVNLESAGTSPPAQRGQRSRSRWPDQGEIAVILQDHVDELRVEPEPPQPEPVEGRPAYQVADARSVNAGILVGDDDGSAGTRNPAHLAQGRGVIFIVGEAADRVASVERR